MATYRKLWSAPWSRRLPLTETEPRSFDALDTRVSCVYHFRFCVIQPEGVPRRLGNLVLDEIAVALFCENEGLHHRVIGKLEHHVPSWPGTRVAQEIPYVQKQVFHNQQSGSEELLQLALVHEHLLVV